MASFKIGINMAGAISAGAYTAGVLDFLTEALDEWYDAKERGEVVPLHDVLIEVFTGASAGGMCAAISALMLQETFDHIHDVTQAETNNRLFKSWVKGIDIQKLLLMDDLREGSPIVSLLDSTIIGTIAQEALTPSTSPPVKRSYVAPDLTLILSLTNLRGVPYSLNGTAPGSIEETTFFFGDHIRFQTVGTGANAPANCAIHPVDVSQPGPAGGWDLLRQAAMATGAFPVFLAPRALSRHQEEYTPPMWESVVSASSGTPPPIRPDFPPELPPTFETLNVDGGVINNDPFNYAHDYLAGRTPLPSGDSDPHSASGTDRAVITIAPFPTIEKFGVDFDVKHKSSIFPALASLFDALISQSRFFGESLTQIMTGTTFSRFVVAPSDPELTEEYRKKAGKAGIQPAALQCGSLGAFGGFLEEGFRAHDYALGRRNCQKFLCDHFLLPVNNVIIASGLTDQNRDKIIHRFGRRAPGPYAGTEKTGEGECAPVAEDVLKPESVWLPVIPLCSKAVWEPVPPVPRAKISQAKLDLIVDLILGRFRAVALQCLKQIPSGPLRLFLRPGRVIIPCLARGPLTDLLRKQLGDSYQGRSQGNRAN
jgi:predicted acylesterase/phospholipase RssA